MLYLVEAETFVRSALQRESCVVVSYSGGKDSTVVLDLVLRIVAKERFSNLSKVVLLYGDTYVENPLVWEHSRKTIEEVLSWCQSEGIPIELRVFSPEPSETFWVSTLGKGYPLPNFRFRWCQRLLKIKPSRKAVSDLSGVMMTGLRLNESAKRKASMLKSMQSRNVHVVRVRDNFEVCAPIKEWADEDVWEYLLTRSPVWGGDAFTRTFEVYKDARGECPLIVDVGGRKGCGARFGCWTCTLVREDKALKHQAEKFPLLKKLYDFREWLIWFLSLPESRTGCLKSGRFLGVGKGTLTKEARYEALTNLLALQQTVDFPVIRDWEVDLIERLLERKVNENDVVLRTRDVKTKEFVVVQKKKHFSKTTSFVRVRQLSFFDSSTLA